MLEHGLCGLHSLVCCLQFQLQLSSFYQSTVSWILIQHIIIWNLDLEVKDYVFWEL